MKKAREFKPRRLDIEAFVDSGEALSQATSLTDLPRLGELAHPGARPTADDLVHWEAQGSLRPRTGGAPERWLHLQARTAVRLECQRCLDPVDTPLAFERRFLFVADEAAAARLAADQEDDVLVISRSFDLLELVEDELLLALPLVPRHETCPRPPAMNFEADEAEDEPVEAERPNPFAALAALKKSGR